MTEDLDTLLTALYVEIDDHVAPPRQGRGRRPRLPDATRCSRYIVAGVPAAHLPEPSPEASATREPTDLAELVAGTSSAATVLADYFFPADSASSASAWAARKYLFRPRSPTVLTLNACCDAAASPVGDAGQGAHRRLGGLPPSPSATSGMVGRVIPARGTADLPPTTPRPGAVIVDGVQVASPMSPVPVSWRQSIALSRKSGPSVGPPAQLRQPEGLSRRVPSFPLELLSGRRHNLLRGYSADRTTADQRLARDAPLAGGPGSAGYRRLRAALA